MESIPELAKLLNAKQIVGKSGRALDGSGLSTANNLQILHNLCIDKRPAKTLEIGLGPGGSALVFAHYHKSFGNAFLSHTAIDPYQTPGYDDAGMLVLENAKLNQYVNIIRMPSAMALPSLIDERHKFDLIYIDGSHIFEDVLVDVYFSHQLLNAHGLMILDDCADSHIKKIVRFLQTNWAEFYQEHSLLPYRKTASTIRYRVGRILNKLQCRAFHKIKDGFRTWDEKAGRNARFINF